MWRGVGREYIERMRTKGRTWSKNRNRTRWIRRDEDYKAVRRFWKVNQGFCEDWYISFKEIEFLVPVIGLKRHLKSIKDKKISSKAEEIMIQV